MTAPRRVAIVLALLVFAQPLHSRESADSSKEGSDLVYFNEGHLARVKSAIRAGDPYFLENYRKILAESELLLTQPADPVVNKTMMPPSGDKHDYLSYAPYRWPDEDKADGLPWKAIDGVTNPAARGPDTDYTRLSDFSSAMETLSFAYYFSGDTRYSDRALELMELWFVNPDTRVNPNLNYTQHVPGLAEGRAAGILEWARISNVITAMQIFERGEVLPAELKAELLGWMNRYLDWLVTNRLGKEADKLPQNHANWYNFQVVGLMIYLGRLDEARAKVEDAKTSRIAAQIKPNGQQPGETGRTKSMHYSCMNLWALANLTYMGRGLDVDLWEFRTKDGRSLPQAYHFLEPFALGEKEWPYKQITPGGAAAAIEAELKPLFSKTSTLLETDLLRPPPGTRIDLLPIDALRYPPRAKLANPGAPTKTKDRSD
ncbi:alginate lyase family protein [Haloferula sp.]|uniref:alginate lyase family protein n=1 Tax=Haloferula sp. TaxID=2497595 RepID=UPI003C71AFED